VRGRPLTAAELEEAILTMTEGSGLSQSPGGTQ
jgi:hypothetical protein